MQFSQVKFCAVAFVLAETILRKTGAEVAHNRIARDFRDHARGGNAETVAIAVDDRRLRQWKRENRQAIDENMVGSLVERGERGPHRLVGGAQNIYRIDLDRIDDADGPDDRAVPDEIVINLLAFFRQQLLGIVQAAVPEFFRKNNGGGYDRTGERAASRFIDTGDGRDAQAAQPAFMPETTTTIHLAN
jgi:hypothetical protein